MNHSQILYTRAQKIIPGGVNSPVRAFKGVDGEPIFFSHGQGAYLYDVDQKTYIDYVGSWGPLILGHAHPEVVQAVNVYAEKGLSFGAPTEIEVELAEFVCQLVPSVEMIRMVSSGTEAAMSAIRLARAYTKRNKILKFNGCYHGHTDSLLVKSGSGLLTLGIPSSAGVPHDIAKYTLVAEFNDLTQVQQIFTAYGDDIAAIIVEPIACNMNCVLPLPEFLVGLRKLCDQYQTLLIFDEVITGFRVSLGGAQNYYKITPDLTIFGKIIGGGMPVGAFGGKANIMCNLAPLGPVYQAGTLSGNPVAMAAGLATLKTLTKPDNYAKLAQNTSKLTHGLTTLAQDYGIPLLTVQLDSIMGLFFTNKTQIKNYEDVSTCNIMHYKRFFHKMLAQGVYFAPSAFEVGFLSTAHTDNEIEKTLTAAHAVFKNF